jgi:hypothetical protein
MQNIAPSFKQLEGESDQDAAANFQRGNKRRNGVVIVQSSPVYIELQKKINEPTTQSSFGSVNSVPSSKQLQ